VRLFTRRSRDRTKDSFPAVVALTSNQLAALRRTFRGELLTPGSDGYDAARQVWNLMVDHRPALIARCLGVGDVASAIRFARERGLEISVRGGGHSIVGHAVVDDAVMIDLSSMRGVLVDPARRRAQVQGGALIADLDRETQHFGLAGTGGVAYDTGVGGYTLGGGYGWLARRFGLACDNLTSVELVTADGSRLVVTAESDPELYWALRGAGANFGVATTFEFALHPLDHAVALGEVFVEMEHVRPALRAFRDLVASADDALSLDAFVGVAGPSFPIPEIHHGRVVLAMSWIWVGDDPSVGEQLGRPLHIAAPVLGETVKRLSYVDLQTGAERVRQRAFWKSSLLRDVGDDVLDAFVEAGMTANTEDDRATVELISLGGAIARVGEDDSAYGHRDAALDFLAISGWTDPAEDEARMSAARAAWRRVARLSDAGVYVNNLGLEGIERVRAAYGAEKFDRLARVKRRVDPENVFRHNQNIPPAPL
jgi:FAD/FMN-containing dehydrogenase